MVQMNFSAQSVSSCLMLFILAAITRTGNSAILPGSSQLGLSKQQVFLQGREYETNNDDEDDVNSPYRPPVMQAFPQPPDVPSIQNIPIPMLQQSPILPAIQSVPSLPKVQAVPTAPVMPNVPVGPTISLQKPQYPGIPSVPVQQAIPQPPSIPYLSDDSGYGSAGYGNNYGDGYNLKSNDAAFGQGY